MYNRNTITPILNHAALLVNILRAAGYNANIVGGALRVLAVGGDTSDVDIAVLCSKSESELLHKDLGILLRPLGIRFELSHTQTYGGANGFIADWRSGDINIIAYDTLVYSNVVELVRGFDYNFNMYLQSTDGLYNVCPLGTDYVYLNTNVNKRHNIERRKTERTPRFRKMLSHLDWSKVNDC